MRTKKRLQDFRDSNCYANEKQETTISQVNASQNSIHTICNIYCAFYPLASIITKRFDNIRIVESSNYLREKNKEECQKETQKKVDELLTSLQRYN